MLELQITKCLCPHHAGVEGEERLSSSLRLDITWRGVVKSTLRPLSPQEKPPSIDRTGGKVKLRYSIDILQMPKFLAIAAMVNSVQRLGYALALLEFQTV
jgi:hypothetical protein